MVLYLLFLPLILAEQALRADVGVEFDPEDSLLLDWVWSFLGGGAIIGLIAFLSGVSIAGILSIIAGFAWGGVTICWGGVFTFFGVPAVGGVHL